MSDTYGYIRVSTHEQGFGRQLDAMARFGVAPARIYADKQGGKGFERPEYGRLMAEIKPGDTLVIKSIDRLGRDYGEILEQWRIITKDRKAEVVVLDMPLLDTRREGRDLTGTFIADLVLQILSYVAQNERESIRQRQAEGIASALARGVRFGRKPMDRPESFEALRESWERGVTSAREAARALGVTHRTFLRWAGQK